MKKNTLFLLVSIWSLYAWGQQKSLPIHVSYYAPYFIQFGGKIGTTHSLKSWKAEEKLRTQEIKLSPELAYFSNPKVQRNGMLNAIVTYTSRKDMGNLYPTYGLGLGYMLSSQRQGGAVNLGTGEIEYTNKIINHLVPTLNLGLAKDPKKKLGYYFRTFYGRKLTFGAENSAFFGAELGLNFRLKLHHEKK